MKRSEKQRSILYQLHMICLMFLLYPLIHFLSPLFLVRSFNRAFYSLAWLLSLFTGETRRPEFLWVLLFKTSATSPLNIEEDGVSLLRLLQVLFGLNWSLCQRICCSAMLLNLRPAAAALLLVFPCLTWQGIAIKVSTATGSPSNIDAISRVFFSDLALSTQNCPILVCSKELYISC